MLIPRLETCPDVNPTPIPLRHLQGSLRIERAYGRSAGILRSRHRHEAYSSQDCQAYNYERFDCLIIMFSQELAPASHPSARR
jgi:hypothetical protein